MAPPPCLALRPRARSWSIVSPPWILDLLQRLLSVACHALIVIFDMVEPLDVDG
jgi:hypothetical protein